MSINILFIHNLECVVPADHCVIVVQLGMAQEQRGRRLPATGGSSLLL